MGKNIYKFCSKEQAFCPFASSDGKCHHSSGSSEKCVIYDRKVKYGEGANILNKTPFDVANIPFANKPAQMVPLRFGIWISRIIETPGKGKEVLHHCTACGNSSNGNTKYCPNCGALMKGEIDNKAIKNKPLRGERR